MLDPLDKESRIANRTLKRVRRWACGVIITERLVKAFGPLCLWLGFFTALWVSGLSASALPTLKTLLSLLFFAGAGALTLYGIKNFSLPTRAEIYRRLETEHKLAHSPLRHFEDNLANPRKSDTRALWQSSQESNLPFFRSLKLIKPAPVTDRIDPLGLRYLVVLFLVCGFVISGGQASERFRQGLFPSSLYLQGASAQDMTLWITPPAYTNQPDIIFTESDSDKGSVPVPEGSQLKARLSSGWGRPKLRYSQGLAIAFDKIDNKNWALETAIPETERLLVTQLFRRRFQSKVNYIKDLSPLINLTSEVEGTAKGALRVPLSLYDDYGVTQVVLQINLPPEIEGPPGGMPVTKSRTIMSPPAQEIKLSPVFDLTSHYWAGLPVVMTLQAFDHVGNVTSTASLPLTLPERPFYNPAAKMLVEIRQELIWEAETNRLGLAYKLESLLSDPAQLNNNIRAFLSIRSMASRLTYDHRQEYRAALIAQMWDTALLIEEGTLSLASRNLTEAREKLEALLQDETASQEAIAQAVSELQSAMSAYFQELAQTLQNQMAENGAMPDITPEMLENALNPEDLANFLDQIRRESLQGDRDAARQMLSQLQQMMDGLDPSQTGQMPPEMKQLAETIAKMQELIEEQKTLREETNALAEQAPGPREENEAEGQQGPSPSSSQEGYQAQEGLRHELGEIMRETGEALPEIPQNMQDAEGEMRQASDALKKSDSPAAVAHQDQTIELLEQGQGEMQQQMSEMMKQMQLMAFGQGPTDPLGRPLQEGNGTAPYMPGQIEIPDEAQRKKAHEILELLRKRSGEYSRPEYEREYFRRLMKKF